MTKYQGPILLKGDYTNTRDFTIRANYLPLPEPRPSGSYRLALKDKVAVLKKEDELTFHLVGDTGSFKNLDAQAAIAAEIVKNATQGKSTDFLYHLGDLVYHHGEASEYPQQFFAPYEAYPGPIFAIAGNHDADIKPDSAVPYKSLEPFMQVFCNPEQSSVPFSNGSSRKSLNQPYVYWTLTSPLATIIGLYGNVAKFGLIDAEQRQWFIQELKLAALEQEDKALIIAVHHSPFSADTNHGSSLYMIDFLDSAFAEAGVLPDLVFSGHVHNYQRFHKTYGPHKVVPYIVAGAGGYAILHSVAETDNPFVTEDERLKDVSLENFCDDKHGFMKLNLKRSAHGIEINGEYYTVSPNTVNGELGTSLFDHFEFTLDRFGEMAY